MRGMLMASIGAIFTTLLLVAPAMHATTWLGARLDAAAFALLTLPFLTLLVAVVGRRTWVVLFGYPVAHLPALVTIPALTERVSVHPGGWALAAMALSGAAWFMVALWPTAAPSRAVGGQVATRVAASARPWAHPLAVTAGLLTLGVFGVFAGAALGGEEIEPLTANVTVIAGAFVAWVVVARQILGGVAEVVLDVDARRRFLATTVLRRRPSRRGVLLSLVAVVVTLSLALFWQASRGS